MTVKHPDDPRLALFREWPQALATNEGLLSSLQTFETSVLVLALDRYPHALTSAIAALESALLAGDIGAERDRLQTRLDVAAKRSAPMARLVAAHGDELRATRNRILHRGYSPQDDSVSVRLMLTAAVPMLAVCYSEFHDFDLLRGLLPDFSRHLQVAREVHGLAIAQQHPSPLFCLKGLAHLILYLQRAANTPDWEVDTLVRAEEIGTAFERRMRAKEQLHTAFGPFWDFDCPICAELEGAVCELSFQGTAVLAVRAICTNCGLAIGRDQSLLSQVLFRAEVAEQRDRILLEFGVA